MVEKPLTLKNCNFSFFMIGNDTKIVLIANFIDKLKENLNNLEVENCTIDNIYNV